MRGRLRSRIRRWGKKSWIFAGLGLVALSLLGGGAYAALGGTSGSQASGDIELQRGLVGHWRLDGNLRDSTPHSSHCSPAFWTPAYGADRKGNASSSLTSNDKWATCGNSSVLSPTVFTASAWVYSDGYTNSGAYSTHGILGKVGGYQIGFTELGEFYINLTSSNNVTTSHVSPGTYATGTWYHVAATFSGSQVVLYVNGQQVLASAYGSPFSHASSYSTSNFVIANSQTPSSNRGWNGRLDDLRLYNRVLTQNEVTALHTGYSPQLNSGQGLKGLVGHWKLDGNLKDSTPNGNNATVIAATPTVDRKGRVNGAYNFPDSGNRSINLGNSAVFNSPEVTMSAWIKPSALSSVNQYIMAKLLQYAVKVDNTGSISVLASNNGSTWAYAGTPTPTGIIVAGNWYHVAVTISSAADTINVYVNGALAGTASTSLAIGTYNTNNLYIGNYSSTGGEPHRGDIDDARFYSRALSVEEIRRIAESYDSQINLNSSPTAQTSTGNINQGLVGYWPFSGNAKDSTPYSNNGTVSGPTLTSDRKGRANSAYLMGANNYINVGNPSTYSNLTSTGFTYSIWLMRTGASAWQWPQIMGAADTHVYYGIRSQNYGDSISFEYGRSPFDGSAFSIASAGTLPVNEWHMYTFTYDGSAIRAYKDGSYVSLSNVGAPNTTFGGLSFNNNVSSNQGWQGSIDDARLYNRPLSATEITALYNSQN